MFFSAGGITGGKKTYLPHYTMDIQNILNNADFITALKWTGTILATGFIAQFGRRFAEHLIDRGKKRRETKRLHKNSTQEPAPIIEKSSIKEVKAGASNEQPMETSKTTKKADKAASKIEKKRLKGEKKNLK